MRTLFLAKNSENSSQVAQRVAPAGHVTGFKVDRAPRFLLTSYLVRGDGGGARGFKFKQARNNNHPMRGLGCCLVVRKETRGIRRRIKRLG